MRKIFTLCIVFVLLLCPVSLVFTQDALRETGIVVDANTIVMLARSNADYRVTPGDMYTLTYNAGVTPVIFTIVVDSSYRIRVSNLGTVNASGKTFVQVKNEIETMVMNNYPLSGVQLVLTQPSVFRVHVNGEVRLAGEFSAWGLSRLSSLIGEDLTSLTVRETLFSAMARENSVSTLTDGEFAALLDRLARIDDSHATLYTSIRDVQIRSANGQTRVYDLFKAQRMGDLSQDPYLRPGDVVTFNRVKRVVTITGEVERPGSYQLLDGENVRDLIQSYGNGFTPFSDGSRIEVIRQVNSKDAAGDKLFLTTDDIARNFTLENYDDVFVPSISQLRPVMFVEGAVTSLEAAANTNASSTVWELTSSTRLVIQYNQGETYASLVRRNILWFTAISDTQNAYIVRDNKHIPLNLNPMLYDASYHDQVLVQENDTLIVPFRQYFVTVAGAVVNPGRYPYIPDREWDYYIALAGGFVAGYNLVSSVNITDMTGKKMRKTDAIVPETIITANANHPLYYFNQVAPVITTILTVITTFLTIQTYMSR